MLLQYNKWLEFKLVFSSISDWGLFTYLTERQDRAAACLLGSTSKHGKNCPPPGFTGWCSSNNPKLLLIPLLWKHRFVRAHNTLPAEGVVALMKRHRRPDRPSTAGRLRQHRGTSGDEESTERDRLSASQNTATPGGKPPLTTTLKQTGR